MRYTQCLSNSQGLVLTHLSLQVHHISLHLVVGLAEVVDLSVQLLDVVIVVQN